MQELHASRHPRVALTAISVALLRLSTSGWMGVAQEVVSSGPGEEGDVRLVSAIEINGYVTGALQVFCDGQWGAVCSSNFDSSDALVACRQLGFATGVVPPTSARPLQRRFAAADDPVLEPFILENLGCRGDESRILDCPVEIQSPTVEYNYYTNNDMCSPFLNTYAFVACGMLSSAEEGNLRLQGGTTAEDGSAEFGRLEIFYQGGWGHICIDNLDVIVNTSTLTVACRMLGYDGGAQVRSALVDELPTEGRVPVPVALDDLQCTGSEATLGACLGFQLDPDTAFSRSCPTLMLNVRCFSTTNSSMEGQVRLADGQSGPGYEYGRLEVFRRGFWGNVGVAGATTPVNDALTLASTQVACSDIGFDGGAVLRFAVPYQTNEATVVPILPEPLLVSLAGVQCEGQEDSLVDCSSFTDEELAEEYGPGAPPDFNGTVVACGTTSAGCEERAAEQEGAVRLTGGSGTPCDPLHSGFVEVYHAGEWGRICLGPFESRAEPADTLVADVACRQLGFPHGTLVIPGNGPDPSDPGTVLLAGVQCRGIEAAVTECNTGQGFLTNTNECPVDGRTISLQLHAACRQFPVLEALEALKTPGAEDGDVRLVNVERVANWVTGDLQLFFAGAWGQVCPSLFGGRDADVACRQLGFSAGSQGYPTTDFDMDSFPEAVLAGSGCIGTERNLLECDASAEMDMYDSSICRRSLRLACVDPEADGVEGVLRLTSSREGPARESLVGMPEIFHAGAWGTLCMEPIGSRDYEEYGRIAFLRIFSEESADLMCQQLGFAAGELQDTSTDEFNTTLLPPWLSELQCNGSEVAVSECPRSEFGDTGICGPAVQLTCFSSRDDVPPRFVDRLNQEVSDARLVGGRADPQGQWEYGRLEVLINGVWIPLDDQTTADNLGRRGVQVACRTLGYATGAQLLAGADSALPTLSTESIARIQIECGGGEDSLTDCEVFDRRDDFSYFNPGNAGQIVDDIALVCTNPSECESGGSSMPVEGDVRLVALPGNSPATGACNDVHFGRVELFHDGLWGRIAGGPTPAKFTLDAAVVCRQLGFPFGGLLDEDMTKSFDSYRSDYVDYGSVTTLPVWAFQVVCLGKEERLLDCDFPGNFGAPPEMYATDDDYLTQAAASAAPAGTPGPDPGLGPSLRVTDFSVVCRRFEIPESNVIRG